LEEINNINPEPMNQQPSTYYSEISSKRTWTGLNFQEVWKFRDLLVLFVRRDFVAVYKQTILGPVWFFIQPILTTVIFVFIFGNLAQLSPDGLPKILFFMSGIVCWNYFSECINSTSNTFTKNSNIFGKVYFPRIIAPLSVVISNLIKFGIQLCLFLFIYFYFIFVKGFHFHYNSTILLFPFLVVLMALLGLGLGLVITAMTTKYRDLTFLVTFGVQLFMYATPVVYSLDKLTVKLGDKYRWIIELNPMTHIIETFRYGFFGEGTVSVAGLIYCAIFSVTLFLFSWLVFNRVERNFMDTV
jgi:lipopolysaccharide transport system permease protein